MLTAAPALAGGENVCIQQPWFAGELAAPGTQLPGPTVQGYLASSIDMDGSGNLAIVGEIFADDDAEGRARTYALQDGHWYEVAAFRHDDAQPGDGFGSAVGISGNVAIIAAGGAEKVFVFKHDGSEWKEHQELPNQGAGKGFGGSLTQHEAVAIDGRTAVAAASLTTIDSHDYTGEVYVYRHSNASGFYEHEATLRAQPTIPGAEFGHAVAISGSRIIVGAPDSGDTGRAYIFRRVVDGQSVDWVQEFVLPDDSTTQPPLGADFGRSVSIYSNVVLVGAPGAGPKGAAYIFRYNSQADDWEEIAKLEPSNPQSGQLFGYAVSLSGSLAVVGAPGYTFGQLSGAGRAYLYQRQTDGSWDEVLIFAAKNPSVNDRTGETLAVSGDVAFIGVLGRNQTPPPQGGQEGAIMIFAELPDCQGP